MIKLVFPFEKGNLKTRFDSIDCVSHVVKLSCFHSKGILKFKIKSEKITFKFILKKRNQMVFRTINSIFLKC